MSEAKSMTAQPSAGAQPVAYQRRKAPTKGGHYETEEAWIDCHPDDLEHYRSMGQEIRALGVIATPAQPDTGDVAALREAFRAAFKAGVAYDCRSAPDENEAWGIYLATPAQPDTGAVEALREALEALIKADKDLAVAVNFCEPTKRLDALAVAEGASRAARNNALAALSKPNAPGREG